MKYIVLLRGINISGKNKISMSELKKVLEENNYKNVITYLNSGNVILESESTKEYISKNIHNIIKDTFNLDIPGLTLNLRKYLVIVQNGGQMILKKYMII